MAPVESMQIEVVYCPQPGQVDQVQLQMDAGATLGDALQASGLMQRHGLALEGLRTGIWCKVCDASAVLRDRDRVEVYRALTVDPKEARRQRYKRQKPPKAA